MRFEKLDGVDRHGNPIRIEDLEERKPWLKRLHLTGRARIDQDITRY